MMPRNIFAYSYYSIVRNIALQHGLQWLCMVVDYDFNRHVSCPLQSMRSQVLDSSPDCP